MTNDADKSSKPPGNEQEFPVAQVRSAPPLTQRLMRQSTKMWIVALACLLVAIGLTWFSFGEGGKLIVISFRQGHGIKPGDTVRHRGIEVGEVESVELSDDFQGVIVKPRLYPNATGLAREGSQFWIERPQVSLSAVRGLDTVVGAKYIAISPGPDDAAPRTEFVGVESPLTLTDTGLLEISIRFGQGHGLAVADTVQYRGIVVGEVAGVEMNEQQSGVDVKVRLIESAHNLARAGTQFWVERPRIGVGEIRGLETLVSGRHIALIPGPADSPRQFQFQGLELAPTGELPEGGLEIVLYGSRRFGLSRGTPMTYRGLKVGHVLSVGLSSDATQIEARVFVEPAYRALVRSGSQFWNVSGFDISVGISGVAFSADSLSTVVMGGVAMATPDPPGDEVTTGARFELNASAEDEWLTWQPHIPTGLRIASDEAVLPRMVRASLQWTERKLGIKRNRQRDGWILPISDGRLIGSSELISIPEKAIDGKATFAVAGKAHSLDSDQIQHQGVIGVLRSPLLPNMSNAWPADRLRRPDQPEDCVLILDTGRPPFPLSAAHLKPSQQSWLVDSSASLSDDWNGACAVADSDGQVIGFVVMENGQAHIALMFQER